MSKFASLSSPSARVRQQLQTKLYYSRKKNRERRKFVPVPDPDDNGNEIPENGESQGGDE